MRSVTAINMYSAVFHMLMHEDMLPAVAALSCAVRTVAEIHLWMALVGDAAHRAAVERSVVPRGPLQCLPRHPPPAAFHHPDQIPGKKEEKIADGSEYE